jgi:hypothetical protein
MSSPAPAALAHVAGRVTVRDDRDADHNFLPDFSWAAAGGGVALIVFIVVLVLTASLGGGAPISAFTRELAGAFLAGFLVVLVARSLSARSR